jgi:3-phenylpropionate/trans-cinnamate dioxygenase ferredoxin reductase component
MDEHLVIVGAGQAAAQAIQTLRQNDSAGRISLVGAEGFPPYQRPPLSKKYLAGTFERDRLYLKPPPFYESRDVDLLLGSRAARLERGAQIVRLDDGRELSYDRMLLATGSRPRRIDLPGADLPGIHYLRSIEDADGIAAAVRPGAQAVIVGAGYIGLEVAAVLRGLGLEVTVLEAANRVMGRVVCPQVSAFYERRHEAAGVTILTGTGVAGFRGDAAVEAVATTGGRTFPCDLVVVGIGVVPNIELASEAGLECSDGIHVDTCARTSDPRIVAAGDCTIHPHPFAKRKIRLESVHNAVEQAKAAAFSILGREQPFVDVPWFWSDQYDLKLQIAGLSLDYDEVVVRGDLASGRFAVYYLAEGRPVAIDAVNSPRDFMNGKKLLAEKPLVTPAQIADETFDLSSLLGAKLGDTLR